MGEDDRRAQVHLERPVDLLDREGVERPRGRQGRVGDQDVDVAGLGHEPGHLGTLGEVDGQGAPAQLGGQRLEHVASPAGQDQLRAAPGEGPGDRVADAARGACEEDRGARDLHEL